MSNIRELSFDEIALVSGGNGSGNYGEGPRNSDSGARNSLARNAPNHIYSDPSTIACANAAFGGLASLPNIGRAAAKEVSAAVQCLNLRGGGNSGNGAAAGSAHCSGNSPAGSCNRSH